jgi:hypothetical protein
VHGGNSLYVADGQNGQLLLHCFAGCEGRDVFVELRDRGLIVGDRVGVDSDRADTGHQPGHHLHWVEPDEVEKLRRKISSARDLYRRAKPAQGTPVETYLRTRGIALPIPPALRFLQHSPHRNGGYYPAMVAPIVNVNGQQIAVHKTFLRPDGSGKADLPKAERRETCGPMKSGSVRLAQPRPEVPLIIGEGIESTLSAMQIFGLPGWAALCANGIEALELPSDIRKIAIAADNDENGVGQEAALSTYQRRIAEGRSAEILLPPNVGQDFNDALASKGQ